MLWPHRTSSLALSSPALRVLGQRSNLLFKGCNILNHLALAPSSLSSALRHPSSAPKLWAGPSHKYTKHSLILGLWHVLFLLPRCSFSKFPPGEFQLKCHFLRKVPPAILGEVSPIFLHSLMYFPMSFPSANVTLFDYCFFKKKIS